MHKLRMLREPYGPAADVGNTAGLWCVAIPEKAWPRATSQLRKIPELGSTSLQNAHNY